MRIDRVNVSDFQGVKEAEVKLGGLTMIYGPNGSGKSSIGDAILYALTGQQARGRVLADAIREGAKGLEVAVDVGGVEVRRKRTASSGSETIGGERAKAGGIESWLEARYELRQGEILAALRSGQILDLPPAALQDLLSGLCEGELDAAAIWEALGDEVIHAAEVARVALPQSLDGFPRAAKTAEIARQAAKRALADAEGDLARLPQAAAPGALPDLGALRRRRDEAVRAQARRAGADEAKLAELRRRLAELAKLPEWTSEDDVALADDVERLAEIEAKRHDLEGMIAKAEAEFEGLVVPSEEPEAGAEAIEEQLRLAREEEVAAVERCGEIEEEGKRVGALLAKLTNGKCPTCEQDAKGLAESLESQKADMKKRWKEAHANLEAIRERVAGLEGALAWHQAQGIERTLTTLRESTTKLETARTELLQHIEAQRKRRSELEARREIPSIERQIAQLEEAMEAPTGESIEDLDRQIAAVEEQAEAQRAGKQRAELEARIERLKAEVEAADTVAQACGPKGAPARLMAQVMGPFLQEANEALEAIFPGATVEVKVEGGITLAVQRGDVRLSPAQLSDGERTRFLYALQSAVSKLAGVGLLVLDRSELLDGEGKRLVMRWVSGLIRGGSQVVMLTSAPAPEAAPPGVTAYAMAEGVASAIASKEVAA